MLRYSFPALLNAVFANVIILVCFSRILLETFEAGQQGRFPHDIVENEETVRMLKSAYTRIDGIPLHFNDNNDDK